MVTKYGTKRGAVVLVRGIPLVGPVIGGSVDLVATRAVGRFADGFFRPGAVRAAPAASDIEARVGIAPDVAVLIG